MRARARAVGALLFAAAATVTPANTPAGSEALKAGVLSPVMAAPDLKLQATDGQALTLARFRGKVVLLAFGFSSCGEVCPITLATLAGARKKLGDAATNVQVVYVTVDPERDDAPRMKKFLASFDPSFVGGVGSRAEIDVAQKSYGISSTKNVYPDGNYTIGHSSSIYMIDRAGGLRAVMPYGHTADDFVHDLKILLRQ
ncbi:MAG TPA: SCO family protein [Steroidobacteraceae bacterium]|nr:SCO family protein [Steroidobacteraceae bacterium]